MSPLRWDVLATGLALGVPVLLLGLRGDLPADDVALRLLWCLGAGWAAVALIRFASTPPAPRPGAPSQRVAAADAPDGDTEPAPA